MRALLVCSRYSLLFIGQLGCIAANIEGTVFEHPLGARVRSASVLISKANEPNAIAEIETNDEGRFVVPGLFAGDYRVEVTKANYEASVLYVRVVPTLTRIIVSVVRHAVISGKVTNAQVEPIAGVKVFAVLKTTRAESAPSSVQFRRGFFDITDSEGKYRLYGLPPGEYAVAVVHQAFARGSANAGGSNVVFYPDNLHPRLFTVTGGEVHDGVNIIVSPTTLYRVAGRVQHPALKGIFSLTLSTANDVALPLANTVSIEADGSFGFDGIPPGKYQIFASGPTGGVSGVGAVLEAEPLFGAAQVEVQQNIQGLSIVVKKGRSTVFTLRKTASHNADGLCPDSIQVTLSPLDHFGASIQRATELRLARETMISDLPPSRYWVSVSGLSETCYQITKTIDLRDTKYGDHVVVLISPAAFIRGWVRNLSSATEVAIVLVAADPIKGVPPVQITCINSESGFMFENLPPGRYRVGTVSTNEVEKSGWRTHLDQMREITLQSGINDVELIIPKT
jgi:hypothetical protein